MCTRWRCSTTPTGRVESKICFCFIIESLLDQSTMPESKPKITHVIFDMDGLILNTEARYTDAYVNLLKPYGKEFTFEMKRMIMGRVGREGAQLMIDKCSLPLSVDQFVERIGQEYEKIFVEPVEPMPGAVRLIKHLSAKGVPIAVATSSSSKAFDWKVKHHQELFSLFNHIIVASAEPEITKGKPDPQTFLVCASRFKVKPEKMSNCLVFEDSPSGIQAANSAEMISVWIPDPRMPTDAAKPFATLASLEQFKPEDFGLPAYD